MSHFCVFLVGLLSVFFLKRWAGIHRAGLVVHAQGSSTMDFNADLLNKSAIEASMRLLSAFIEKAHTQSFALFLPPPHSPPKGGTVITSWPAA